MWPLAEGQGREQRPQKKSDASMAFCECLTREECRCGTVRSQRDMGAFRGIMGYNPAVCVRKPPLWRNLWIQFRATDNLWSLKGSLFSFQHFHAIILFDDTAHQHMSTVRKIPNQKSSSMSSKLRFSIRVLGRNVFVGDSARDRTGKFTHSYLLSKWIPKLNLSTRWTRKCRGPWLLPCWAAWAGCGNSWDA